MEGLILQINLIAVIFWNWFSLSNNFYILKNFKIILQACLCFCHVSVSFKNIKLEAIVVPSVDKLFADKFSNHLLHCMKENQWAAVCMYAQHKETHRKLETSGLTSQFINHLKMSHNRDAFSNWKLYKATF